MIDIVHPEQAHALLAALETYRPARRTFLAALDVPTSNRDPLAEFSESLVQALMGGALAKSRVQPGHDLVLADERAVQVRYLANTGPTWVNEHVVYRIAGVELYALVIFEEFAVVGVLVFPTAGLSPICAALGKRHPRREEQLQFTSRNWRTIHGDIQRFEALGMQIWMPPLRP
jgi:hypothetical protein